MPQKYLSDGRHDKGCLNSLNAEEGASMVPHLAPLASLDLPFTIGKEIIPSHNSNNKNNSYLINGHYVWYRYPFKNLDVSVAPSTGAELCFMTKTFRR